MPIHTYDTILTRMEMFCMYVEEDISRGRSKYMYKGENLYDQIAIYVCIWGGRLVGESRYGNVSVHM